VAPSFGMRRSFYAKLYYGKVLAWMAVSTLGLENADGNARKPGVCLEGREARRARCWVVAKSVVSR
jgi:hypothetical protein